MSGSGRYDALRQTAMEVDENRLSRADAKVAALAAPANEAPVQDKEQSASQSGRYGELRQTAIEVDERPPGRPDDKVAAVTAPVAAASTQNQGQAPEKPDPYKYWSEEDRAAQIKRDDQFKDLTEVRGYSASDALWMIRRDDNQELVAMKMAEQKADALKARGEPGQEIHRESEQER